MSIKPFFSKDEFNSILLDYNLGEYKKSKPITTGAVQSNYFLETTNGRFVFKYYKNRSINSILFEIKLIQYLRNKDYPCPAPYKNKYGKYYGIYNEKPFVIFEFIAGKHLENLNQKQRNEIIKRAAQLHNITKNYRPCYKRFRLNYGVELCRKLVEEKSKKINTKNSRDKLKWFKEELSKLKLPKSLPKGICHCDFHFSNFLFKKDKLTAVIDFDDANYTFLIFDAACLINPFIKSFEWNTWANFEKNEKIFSFKESQRTISEYIKYRQLNNTEKKYLFDVFKLSVMFDCVWYFDRGNAEDFYEKRKIEYLDSMGREKFKEKLFSNKKIN